MSVDEIAFKYAVKERQVYWDNGIREVQFENYIIDVKQAYLAGFDRCREEALKKAFRVHSNGLMAVTVGDIEKLGD